MLKRVVLLTVLWSVSACSAATYYVAPGGHDDWPGTSAQPFETPFHGAEMMTGGDTLRILAGDYLYPSEWSQGLEFPSGSVGDWTAVIGQPDTRLFGRGNCSAGFAMYGHRYVSLDTLEFTAFPGDSARAGIAAELGGPFRFTGLYIHHIDEDGLDLWDTRDVTLRNCTFRACGGSAVSSGDADSIGVFRLRLLSCRFDSSGFYWRGDTVNPFYDRPDGVGLEESGDSLLIEDCIAVGNRGDGFDSKLPNTTIRRSIAAGNRAGDGIKLWQGNSMVENCLAYDNGWTALILQGGTAPRTHYRVINCTFASLPEITSYIGTIGWNDTDPLGEPMGLELINNVFSNSYGVLWVSPRCTLTVLGNLFEVPTREEQLYANGRDYTADQLNAGELGPTNRSLLPGWIDPDNGDFHLGSGSSAIDQGVPMGAPSEDLEHRPRPYGSGWDIGCYEYNPLFIPLPEGTARRPSPLAFPNPFRLTTRLEIRGSGPITIRDSMGRIVRRLNRGLGEPSVLWDGHDDSGDPLPADLYYFSAQSAAVRGTVILLPSR